MTLAGVPAAGARAVRGRDGPRHAAEHPRVPGRDAEGAGHHCPRQLGTELNETAVSYEAVLRSFFSEILEAPPDQALIQLWMLGLELAFADLRDTIEEEISPLFSPWEEPL